MIKAILSDFDGTLVSDKGTYHPQTKDLIKKLQKKGICFSIATGRSSMARVGEIIKELEIDGYHIFNGGAVIMDTKTGIRHWYQPISPSSAQKIIDYLKNNHIVFITEKPARSYLSNKIEIPPFLKGTIVDPLDYLVDYTDIVKIVVLVSANYLDATKVRDHIIALESLCADLSYITYQYGEKSGFDLTSEKSTKHTAVLEYLKILGLKKEEVVGIGNDFNDYPLFTACGYTIAMPDSPKELKEIANFIAPKGKNGMVSALEKILSL